MPNSFLFSPVQKTPSSNKPTYPSLVEAVDLLHGEKDPRYDTSSAGAVCTPKARQSHQQLPDTSAGSLPAVTAWWRDTSTAPSAAASGPIPVPRFQAQAFTPSWTPGAATIAAYDALCRDGQGSSAPRIAEIIGNATLIKMLYQWAPELPGISASTGQTDYAVYAHRLVLWVLENLLTVSALTQDSGTYPAQLGCTPIDGRTQEPVAPEERQAFNMLREKASRLQIVQYRLALDETRTMTVYARYPFKSDQLPRIAFHLTALPHKELHTLLQELVEQVESVAKAAPSRPEKRKAPEPLQDPRGIAGQQRQVFTYHSGNRQADTRTEVPPKAGNNVRTLPPPLVYQYRWNANGTGAVELPVTEQVHVEHAPPAASVSAQPAGNGTSNTSEAMSIERLMNPATPPVAPMAMLVAPLPQPAARSVPAARPNNAARQVVPESSTAPPVASPPGRPDRRQVAGTLPAAMPGSVLSHGNTHSNMAQLLAYAATLPRAAPSSPVTGSPQEARSRLRPILPSTLAPKRFSDKLPTSRREIQEILQRGFAGELGAGSAGQDNHIEITGGDQDIKDAGRDYLLFIGQEACPKQNFHESLRYLCSLARRVPGGKTALVEMASIGAHAPVHYFIRFDPGREIVLIVAGTRARLLYQPKDHEIRKTSNKMGAEMALYRR